MCRFYGFTLEYIENIDVKSYNMLFNGMKQLEAKEMLRTMSTNDFPHLKNKDRKQVHKELFKIAYPENFKKKIIRNEDLKLV